MTTRPEGPPVGLDRAADVTLHASRALLAVIARSLNEALDEVSLPQYRVLVLLATEGPLRSGVVAERMGIHPSTFTRNADRLVAGGWVQRIDEPGTRLTVLIELTDAGRDLVDRVTARRREEIAAILAGMADDERATLADALEAFTRAAGGPAPGELSALGM
ncbi:MarR family transcriptional regulator [Isoptericola sp. b441]|uniref:MarR family transcriptional regulator n=1 Tax=Actinotalea lenta TaxID=3064654 RepID=A0ABT9D4X1_9CELL|nr:MULTISPECIES: MarR family transcriptional regulator [unclassified Isoptericola]MDO8105770.1 MarR family transcriptional regulator [Isoptericola sp. b441]MDO8122475.1 MarR family transcriptional regulator [Isoptericola sp. b490]